MEELFLMKNDLSTSEKAKYDELDEFVKSINSNEHDLIAVLHRAQSIFGYLPEEVQRFIAEELNIPVVKVYGVVTFYSFFTMEKQGKYVINVCLGTACFVRGSEKILKEFQDKLGIKAGQTTEDGLYTLQTLRCVGACGLAPVVQVNGKTYGNSTLETVKLILEEYK
jgi:NADH-quinone oxidoreductase subunit E